LFVGSSSIVNWRTLIADFPRYSVLNRGFGGSETADALSSLIGSSRRAARQSLCFMKVTTTLLLGKR
jgi:hypothetical protein